MNRKLLLIGILLFVVGLGIGWFAGLARYQEGPFAQLKAMTSSAQVYGPNMSCASLRDGWQYEQRMYQHTGLRQHGLNAGWLYLRYARAGCGNY